MIEISEALKPVVFTEPNFKLADLRSIVPVMEIHGLVAVHHFVKLFLDVDAWLPHTPDVLEQDRLIGLHYSIGDEIPQSTAHRVVFGAYAGRSWMYELPK